jgi:predicted membrane chloride channel (bestrophin family)
MITYNRSAFGWILIFHIHGSAVYRSILPAALSVALFFLFRNRYRNGSDGNADLLHPNALGVLVTSATFVIVFRLNQGYNRYWEACGSVFHMASKWMDAATQTSISHLQSDHFRKVRPPSFFDYPELNHLCMTRDRERSTHINLDRVHRSRIFQCREEERAWPAGRGLRLRSPGSSETECNRVGETGRCPVANPRISPPPTRQGNIIRSRFRGNSNDESIHHVSCHEGDRVAVENLSSNRSIEPATRAQQMRNETNGEAMKSINLTQNKNKRLHERLNILFRNRGAVRSGTSGSESSVRDSSDSMDTLGEDDGVHDDCQCTGGRGSRGQPIPLWAEPRMDGGWGRYYTTNPENPVATFYDPLYPDTVDKEGFASIQGGRTPTLFMQELAHLSSLLVAVALSTLPNNIEGAETPLAFYEPGKPWPEVDPHKDEWLKMDNFMVLCSTVRAFLSIGTSAAERTRYNSLRPLPVVCGVSKAEIQFLRMARGPYAKTLLCFNWLSEFIVREHLAGSLGPVGAPIVSRILQYLSDGLVHYNHARKIMFIPFPFAHAQLSCLFTIVMVPAIAFLMDQYTGEIWLGAALTFLTVMCLSGINEVGRELENPFRNIPNELPLVTFQAQVNEALMTMYSGFHPDFFWDRERASGSAINAPGGVDRPASAQLVMDVEPLKSIATGASSDTVAEKLVADALSTHTTATTNGSASSLSSNAVTVTHCADKHGSAIGELVESVGECVETSSSKDECSCNPRDIASPIASSRDSNEVAELKFELMNQSQLIDVLIAKVGTLEGMKENDGVTEGLTN